jgi:toxin ParE1/3/4
MKTYRVTETADAQLQDIWRFTAKRWNPDQANAYLGQLESAVVAALATPALLRPRPELGKDIFAIPAGSHIIYCVAEGDILAIVAILHARQDPRRNLMRP